MTYKRVTTSELKRLSKQAVANGFGNSADETLWSVIDNRGAHILAESGYRGHDFVRCVALVKLRGTNEPETLMIDLSPEDFGSLKTAEARE